MKILSLELLLIYLDFKFDVLGVSEICDPENSHIPTKSFYVKEGLTFNEKRKEQ